MTAVNGSDGADEKDTSPPASCLIIDDSEATRRQLRGRLEHAGVFQRFAFAGDGLQGYRQVRKDPVDLVLCDLDMPGFDGFKFLRMKAADPRLAEIPVILLTGREDVESKIKGLSAGASDYLTKPFNDLELIARVNVHLNLKRLRDQLTEKNQELERIARVDGLTGVANRRFLMEALEAEFVRCRRYRRPFTFIMIDLDHFKRVNDEFGHQVGDEVLEAAAQVMCSTLRINDLVGRYGGEEFAVMLPETAGEGAWAVADRCRRLIETLGIESGGRSVPTTASVGMASVPQVDVHTVADLVRLADGALYEAKHGGRNRVVVASALADKASCAG